MATKGKRPMRALTPSDKIEAIQRVNDGESKASVARDIGVPESTLRGWCKNEDKLRYMTSRLSSPETDKSNDGEPAEKRARTESPVAPQSPAAAGLDLSAPPAPAHHAHQPPPHGEAPVELTTRRAEPASQHATPRERRPDPGASVSMSAISPLSGLAHLPSLTHSHLGLSFNEIATNLTLLAQLNPGLSGLSAQPASRALRSVRSPKPAHNGVLNLNESKHRSKSHHSSDPYRHGGSKSSHHGGSQSAGQPVDDTLWYWLKTQQAMLDLTAQTTTAHTLQLGKPSEPSLPPKPVAPAPPINSHLDYNRNSWLWQYYKQFGGAVPLPEDKLKSASQVPKDKTAENILYSQLTKGKTEEEHAVPTSPVHAQPQIHSSEIREPAPEPRVPEPRLPEPRVPEPRVPEHRVPEHRMAEHRVPEHRMPEHRVPEPRMPEHRVSEPRVPESRLPESRVPESRVPESRVPEPRVPEPVASPDVGAENKECTADKNVDTGRSQTKARIVLDNLLFNNTSQAAGEETRPSEAANGEWESGTAEALEHGEKFLRWLESSGDPSVTRMHVHQLSALLHNLRTRRAHQHLQQQQQQQQQPAPPAAPAAAEHAPRRK